MQTTFRNPLPTVDILIEVDRKIVLIERKNPPHGWAIPGGFVDWGESVEACAIREAREETSLDVRLTELFYVYSDPSRDPRHHTVTTVFLAVATRPPLAADDAQRADLFRLNKLPSPLAFDHGQILQDYARYRKGETKHEIFGKYLSI